jgi:hypothetical protein
MVIFLFFMAAHYQLNLSTCKAFRRSVDWIIIFFIDHYLAGCPLNALTITRPDDWHIHLRDGAALARTVPDIARTFHRTICMPNLVPPVKTVADTLDYRERIMAHVPAGVAFDVDGAVSYRPNRPCGNCQN